MGQSFVQHCCESARDVAIRCPGCSADQEVPRRRKVEELSEEVDLAKQDNERLQEEALKLKLQSGYQSVGARGGHGGYVTQADKQLTEELLALKRGLWDLQRENEALKDQRDEGACADATPAVPHGDLNALRCRVAEMQGVHEKAARQIETLRQQHSAGGPRHFPAPGLRSHDRLSRTSSPSVSGHGFLVPGPEASSPQEEAELRRKVQALMGENEQLRRKVRMLAAS